MILTKNQKAIYEIEKYLDSDLAKVYGSVIFPHLYDEKKITDTINTLFKINDALRIHFVRKNNDIEQEFIPYHERQIEVLRFNSEKELEEYANNSKTFRFQLNADLYEIKAVILPHASGFIIKAHYCVSDDYSLYLLAHQFLKIINGETVETHSYIDYIKHEEEYLKSEQYQSDREFYLRQLKKYDEPFSFTEKTSATLAFNTKTFVLSQEYTRVIKDFCLNNMITPFAYFMCCFAMYISRIKMNAEQFYANVFVLRRPLNKWKNTVGGFSNLIPSLFEIDNKAPAINNLTKVQNEVISMLFHQNYNIADLFAELKKDIRLEEVLSDITFVYRNLGLADFDDAKITLYNCGKQVDSLEFIVEDNPQEGVFKVSIDYQTDKFSEENINDIFTHTFNLIFSAIKNADKPLPELEILSPSEKKTLADFNKTEIKYLKNICVHELFEKECQSHPNKIALVASDATLTYQELNNLSNIIAHNLIKSGVKKDDIVAFTLPRRSYLIASMLGILKAGATYLPIDPSFPSDRIKTMLDDCKAKLFINEENIKTLIKGNNTSNLGLKIDSHTACYCIYTSGSTGKPKGTRLTHQNVVNYLSSNKYNQVNSYVKKHFDSIVATTTCSFDIFVTETLMPLANGLKVILANEEEAKIPAHLDALILKNDVDILQTTPSKMKTLIADNKHLAYLKKLKAIILGGEALDTVLANRLRNLSNAKLFNIYGPTETTVWSTNLCLKDDMKEISIGKPIANTQIYIVDKYLNLMPLGVVGELCIAGDGVGLGYLNRPELNKEKFVDNPFGPTKLYKTGDLAYWQKDGNIMYVGRTDFQIKIRGLRIELGEIESAIASIDGVNQVVVVVRKNQENRQLICAFYTGKEIEDTKIRTIIAKTLPKYMLPHFIVHLKEMPTTISGKIDRKALPDINLDHKESKNTYVAPKNDLEAALSSLMAKVLNVSKVGIEDNFFELGGDSLKVIELVSRARNSGLYFSLQDVFDSLNVKNLTKKITNNNNIDVSYNKDDFKKYDKHIKNNVESNLNPHKEVDIGNVLITGATGFLGAHILADYLDHEKGIAYCLVRGSSLIDSQTRLDKNLEYYFLDKYKHHKRIKVIVGSLDEARFGLKNSEFEMLAKKVDTIFHAAASVKNYGSYEFFYNNNVITTKRVVDFALKANAKLIHVSTTSVSGDEFSICFNPPKEVKNFLENCFYINQPLNNVYAHSKFEAEKVVLEAMSKGLKANIMRMGNLTNRHCDLKFQKNYSSNAFLRKMRSFIDLTMIPNYLLDIALELSPVDASTRALMVLTKHFNMDQTIFHLKNLNYTHFDIIIEALKEIDVDIKVCSEKEFSDALSSSQSTLPYIYEGLITNLDEKNRACFNSDIYVDAMFTNRLLNQYGFNWPSIDKKYLQNYYRYFKNIGYFKS